MKLGLILPTNLYFAPYLNIYTQILKKKNIDYDVLFWDREGIGETDGIVYNKKSDKTSSKLTKLKDFFLFSRFITKELKKNNYDKLIVFNPQIALFLYKYLKKKYSKKLLLDYRDLSIEQIFPKQFEKLLSICSNIIISSPGYKKCLPSNFNYILSHNFDINTLKNLPVFKKNKLNIHIKNKPTRISTIGGIRDFDQNKELIENVKNDDNFILSFFGKGIAEESLKLFSKQNRIKNTFFSGFYKKNNEYKFYLEATFINIYYPKILSHETAISNRFYNSLIYKRPMIVTKNSIQGDFVEKYNLGIVVSDCDDIKEKLNNYINSFNETKFIENCNNLLKEFEIDYFSFESSILKFINN
jgi:hypothetical protein